MAEKLTRRRPMVNVSTISKCPNIGFLGQFLNMTGGRRADLLEHLGMTTQGFCRWFSVDDIKWSIVVSIFDYFGFGVKMVFKYKNGNPPSRAMAASMMNVLDPDMRLTPLFVEMKLNNMNFEMVGKKIGMTPQAVNHWFIEDDTSVSNIRKFAEAFGATIEFEPFER